MSQRAGPAVNEAGDVVLAEPATIEALADLDRFRLFSHLQRTGPVQVDALAVALDTPTDSLLVDLAVLGEVGLAVPTSAGWTAPGRGLYIDTVPRGAEAAVRRLYGVMISDTTDLPNRWVAEQAGRLDGEWFRASGMFNAKLSLTKDELDELQVRLEDLLAQYLSRQVAPDDAKAVRVLAYFMAELD